MEGLPIVRPNPLLWLRYAYIGSLPHKYDGWVLRDATCPTWILRHAARYLALVTPIVTPVLIFLPAPFSLRFMSCLVAMLTMMLFYMAFTADSIESRVQNAGFAPGTATRLREQRALTAQRNAAARYRARH